jgi:hypothetical protein
MNSKQALHKGNIDASIEQSLEQKIDFFKKWNLD